MQNLKKLDELETLITRLYDQTLLIGPRIRHDAAKALIEDGSPEAIDALTDALIRSDDSKIHKLAIKALLEFAAENRTEAQEALCRLVIEHDHPLARQIVLAAQYAPHDPVERLLFYFLTEQWDSYEALDRDQSVLTALYSQLADGMQRRIAEGIQRSDRPAWIGILPGERPRKRAGAMTNQDWETALSAIIRQGAWQNLWQLVYVAPASWSVRFLLWLRDVRWQSELPEEQKALTTLIRLAEECHKMDASLPYGLVSCQGELGSFAGGMTCLTMSPDGKILAGGTEEGGVRLWQFPQGRVLRTLENPTGYILCVAINPDGKILASGDEGGTVKLWNLPDGSAMNTVKLAPDSLECLAVSPDGRMLASGGGGGATDHMLRLWRLPDGAFLRTLEGRTTRGTTCLAFSPDGQTLTEGHDNGRVQVWHLSRDNISATLKGHGTDVTCLAFSPDGQMLASGSSKRPLTDIFYNDPGIQLWRVSDGSALSKLEGHPGTIEGLAFSPDGMLLASCGGLDDKTVRIWRLPDGSLLQTLTDHICPVTCGVFSPNGQSLATGSSDGTVRVWDLSLADLRHLNVGYAEVKKLELLQERLQAGNMTDTERRWLKLILVLTGWNQKPSAAKEAIPQTIRAGEFDVEL